MKISRVKLYMVNVPGRRSGWSDDVYCHPAHKRAALNRRDAIFQPKLDMPSPGASVLGNRDRGFSEAIPIHLFHRRR